MKKEIKKNRKVVVDIETTGMNKKGKNIYEGHRIIEIGGVEIINRELTGNNFHVYINPNQIVDPQAFKIHRISNKFLQDKPTFKKIYKEFLNYICHSEIIVHNEKFDIAFLNYELKKVNIKNKKVCDICKIIDTLKIARFLFPGKKNNLHALCNRYNINIQDKKLHSALFDSHILAKLYLLMTRKQKKINFYSLSIKNNISNFDKTFNHENKIYDTPILKASKKEIKKHSEYLKNIKKLSNNCIWNKK